MPWERKTVDNQRSEFVARATMGEESLSALCRKYGISRPTGYKWLERYKGGETMLDRPHTPFRKPFKTSPDVELRIRGCAGRTSNVGRSENPTFFGGQG